MQLKVIKTRAGYDAATAEIERLWGAPADTPEGDRLELLMVLVEDYERRNACLLYTSPSPRD